MCFLKIPEDNCAVLPLVAVLHWHVGAVLRAHLIRGECNTQPRADRVVATARFGNSQSGHSLALRSCHSWHSFLFAVCCNRVFLYEMPWHGAESLLALRSIRLAPALGGWVNKVQTGRRKTQNVKRQAFMVKQSSAGLLAMHYDLKLGCTYVVTVRSPVSWISFQCFVQTPFFCQNNLCKPWKYFLVELAVGFIVPQCYGHSKLLEWTMCHCCKRQNACNRKHSGKNEWKNE